MGEPGFHDARTDTRHNFTFFGKKKIEVELWVFLCRPENFISLTDFFPLRCHFECVREKVDHLKFHHFFSPQKIHYEILTFFFLVIVVLQSACILLHNVRVRDVC